MISESIKRGDIYIVSLDPTLGHEQAGSRPVIIVSPEAFNQATKLPVVLPITSGGQFARRLGFAVELSGCNTTGIIRCDQPRVLDLTARHGRKVDSAPQSVIDDMMAKISTIFE